MVTETDMMKLRRTGLSRLADLDTQTHRPFDDIRIEIGGYMSEPDVLSPSIADAITDRLVRNEHHNGPGVAVITGISRFFEIEVARAFHENIFKSTWNALSKRMGYSKAKRCLIKTGVISDGAIPVELYGSKWSFKDLHIDREVLLFSHLYGPVMGFSGGSIELVDIWPYMRRRKLRFEDVFEWSDEPTAGSKPVLRQEHCATALAECGVQLDSVGPDEIIIINNFPGAGILHGVTPVVVRDATNFQRQYHRCSVKDPGTAA